MTLREKSSYKDVTKNILDKMPNIGKWQYYFILETFGLLLSIKGRLNFLGLARYGKRGEQHYRSRFAPRGLGGPSGGQETTTAPAVQICCGGRVLFQARFYLKAGGQRF
jgi:hypothetical protein